MMIRQCNQTAIKNSTGLKHMSISNTCANRLPIADTRSRVGKNEHAHTLQGAAKFPKVVFNYTNSQMVHYNIIPDQR